jgi:ribose/xylose/arabinose/galactoside ABC-type transport system permease subunit
VWDFGGKKLAVVGMLDKLAPLAGVQVEGVKDGTYLYTGPLGSVSGS